MKIKAIIFDFDGVLAESVHIKSEAYYKLYLPFGIDVAQKVLAHHLANGGMSRFEKFKLYHEKYLNISLNESGLNELVEAFSDLVKNAVVAVNEVEGANQFLNEDRNFKYWIISATPQAEIAEIVKCRKMENYFEKGYGSPRSKSDCVAEILADNNLDPNEVVFVGDAKSDYIAANNNSLHFVLRETDENNDLFKNKSVVKIKNLTELDSALEEL